MTKMFEEGIKAKLNYREMGKLMINLKLLNNNILLLKYKNSYGPVKNLKRMNISDDIKNLLFYILDTNNLNYDNIRDLDEHDHDLIIDILQKSGLDVIYR